MPAWPSPRRIRSAGCKCWRKAFLKADGDPYDPAKAFKKALLDRLPDLPDRYLEAVKAMTEVSDRLALFRMLEGTVAALTIADWLIVPLRAAEDAAAASSTSTT